MKKTTALALVAAMSGLACRTTTEVVVYDPAPGVSRLRAGESVAEEVDRLVKPLIASGDHEGMIVAVVDSGGHATTFAYGDAGGPGDPAPPSGDTLFQVGSLTKVFVAALLSVLVEERVLKPGDTVREILPPEVPLSPDAGAITLHELATHTSGLPREPTSPRTLLYAIDYMFTGHNLYRYLTLDRALDYLRDLELPPKAGRRVEYSNLATGLLAHLIEVRTGRTLPDLVAEKITGPLGMHDTVFTPGAARQLRLAQGHVGGHPCLLPRHDPLPPWDLGDFLRGSGGLYSTLEDLMILARVNLGLQPHPLAAIFREMQRPLYRAPREEVALGWIVHSFEGSDVKITYKYGIVSGYSAYLGMNVEKQLAVVVLSNSFQWDDKVGHNLLLRLSGAQEAAPDGIAARRK